MRKPSRYPTPKKRVYHGTWEIYWNWKGRRYVLYLGPEGDPDLDVETDFRQLAYLLAKPDPEFPDRWAQSAAVKAYLRERFGVPSEEEEETAPRLTRDEILVEYSKHLYRHCAEVWARNSINRIKALDKFVPGGAVKTTPALANRFLDRILDDRKPATRNRTLSALNRFFGWCIANEHLAVNPCTSIDVLKEADLEEISYCTKDERARVLAVAESLDRPDSIAIPIALYAGCRREEIFRLRWEDINFSTKRMTIRKSKTGKKRITPIAKELFEVFEKARQDRGPVVPTVVAETWQNQADRLVELVRDQLCRPENPNLAGHASEPVGKWRFLRREDDYDGLPKRLKALETRLKRTKRDAPGHYDLATQLAGQEACPGVAHDGGKWIPAERIGWNAWRHTFATLRAQAGVSIDKVSSWMGNTYSVCKKHYTQFMPRDEHDEDIDKM